MDVNVDAAGSDNLTFPGDHFCSRSDNNVYIRLNIGIASFADSSNPTVLNSDIGFHNSPVIENQCVGYHRVHGAIAAGTLRLTHPVADDLPASEFHFLSVGGEVLLHLDDQVRVGKAHLVPDRWAKHLRVGGTIHFVRHFSASSVIFGNAPITAWLNP